MPGVAGMAALVSSSTQRPYMAKSIYAVEARLTPERMADLALDLLEAAQNFALLFP
jgi:DNA-binding IclR family transcriptional regulator